MTKKKKSKRKSRVENKRKGKIVGTITIMASVAAILAVIFQIFDIKFPIRSRPNIDVMEGSVNVEYLKKIRDDGDEEVYPLFSDAIDDKGKNNFSGNCATQIYIDNKYEEEIVLTKIIFEAQDIIVNTRPRFELENLESSQGMDLGICNVGWGDGKNVNMRFEGVNGDKLDDFLKSSKQQITVPLVRHGEFTQIHVWNNEDFLKDGSYEFIVNCSDENGEIETGYWNADRLGAYIEDGRFIELNQGAPSSVIYGIKIDTSKNEYIKEEFISESIESHGRLELPICFLADKSCDFKFRVGFELLKRNNKEETIWTDYAKLAFEISSIDTDLKNAADYSNEELMEEINEEELGSVIVTYPYIDKETLKYVEPF